LLPERSERILRENIDKLHLMADALMKYETIDRLQIDDIMEGRIPRDPQGWEDQAPPSGGEAVDAAARPEETGGFGRPATQH
jgi:cell division protease FtsH